MKNALLFVALLAVAGCQKPAPKGPAIAVPPPPAKAHIALYPDAKAGFTLQNRPGDCRKVACSEFSHDRWENLPAQKVSAVSLLTVEPATGSTYVEDLWRPVGANGNLILINSQAGEQNRQRGLADGSRIGLRSPRGTTYLTAYAFEDGPSELSIYISGDKAWLLHVRRDGSSNLVDLFAVSKALCLPGLYLDTAAWAGPMEKALSPDIFISRDVDPVQATAQAAKVETCAGSQKPEAQP